MGDFGHEAARVGNMHIDAWGSGPFVIMAGGKSWRFEDSDRFGPALIDKRGDPLKNPWPGERSPFWRAHRIWSRQGRRVQADRITCIWDEPKPTTFKRLGNRSGIIVEAGDEDGQYVDIANVASPSPGRR